MNDNENTKKLHELGYGNSPSGTHPDSPNPWDPKLWNPFADKYENPTTVRGSRSLTIGDHTYTLPEEDMTDVATVLGTWFARISANYSEISPTYLTDKVMAYVATRPALQGAYVADWCDFADSALQQCLRAKPK